MKIESSSTRKVAYSLFIAVLLLVKLCLTYFRSSVVSIICFQNSIVIVDISIKNHCTVSLCVDFQSYEGQIVLFITFLYYSHNIYAFSFQLDINYFHFIVLILLCKSHIISNVEKCTFYYVNIFVFYLYFTVIFLFC